MSVARSIVDLALRVVANPSATEAPPENPESIFVLRNNDIGDLLVITPLFQALKRRFPAARICAGIGPWNNAVLANNPWVDEVLPVSAPWHNKQTAKHNPNSLAGWRDALRYVFRAGEARALRQRACSIGIDVLGSPQGALLMLRARIPFRIGVRGYAGGHTACHRWVDYDPNLHVGASALRVAKLLGATELPENRPQLFLTGAERTAAEKLWRELEPNHGTRVLIAPGGGFAEKCWPIERFVVLAQAADVAGCSVGVIGGPTDKHLGAEISRGVPRAADWTGKTSLRETFALIGAADLVLTNSSMAMHVGAALFRRTVVLLGASYTSARQHARQWGYEGDFLVLGDPVDSEARTPDEVLALLRARHWLSHPR